MKQISRPIPGQLDFFAMFDAVDQVIEVATSAPALKVEKSRGDPKEHPAGSYLIRSDNEQAFWSNELGWVADLAFASPFTAEHACRAHVTQWRRDGKEIHGTKGHWYWIGKGGLAGYQYADWDGPFENADAARNASLESIGPGRPLTTAVDAEYVLATEARCF